MNYSGRDHTGVGHGSSRRFFITEMSLFTLAPKTYPIEYLFRLFNRYYWTRMALSSIGNTIPNDQQSIMTEKSKNALEYDAWFRSAGAAESMPDLLVEMRPRFRHPPFEGLRLGTMLYKFRDQKATNPKDRIYAFLGMAKKEYEIKPEYNDKLLTKRNLYVLTTRKLLARVLIVLLWIESPEREGLCGAGWRETAVLGAGLHS